MKQQQLCLTNDQVIAIPTETVYALAGNALSIPAVTKIYEIKTHHLEETKKALVEMVDVAKELRKSVKEPAIIN